MDLGINIVIQLSIIKILHYVFLKILFVINSDVFGSEML